MYVEKESDDALLSRVDVARKRRRRFPLLGRSRHVKAIRNEPKERDLANPALNFVEVPAREM